MYFSFQRCLLTFKMFKNFLEKYLLISTNTDIHLFNKSFGGYSSHYFHICILDPVLLFDFIFNTSIQISEWGSKVSNYNQSIYYFNLILFLFIAIQILAVSTR